MSPTGPGAALVKRGTEPGHTLIARALGLALAILLALPTRADEQPLETVDAVDLERYAGRWYQIALLPNAFQRQCARDTSATYRLLDDGQVEVVNACVGADGKAQVARGLARVNAAYGDPARLEVRFAPAWLGWLPFVWGDYWILALEPDYSAVLVGAPGHEYLWVLAREKSLDAGVYARLVEHAAAQGFEVSKLVREPGTTLVGADGSR